MKRKVRLTESDLHRIVKESVSRMLKESSYDSMGNFGQESHNNDNRKRLTDELKKIAREMSQSISTIGNIEQCAVGDEEVTRRARSVISALIDASRKIRNVTQLIYAKRWDVPA